MFVWSMSQIFGSNSYPMVQRVRRLYPSWRALDSIDLNFVCLCLEAKLFQKQRKVWRCVSRVFYVVFVVRILNYYIFRIRARATFASAWVSQSSTWWCCVLYSLKKKRYQFKTDVMRQNIFAKTQHAVIDAIEIFFVCFCIFWARDHNAHARIHTNSSFLDSGNNTTYPTLVERE